VGAILGVLLAISVAGNAWQYHEHDKLIEAKATALQLNEDTKGAAQACTASVKTLADDSRRRQGDLATKVGEISGAVGAMQKKANQALQAKPDNPADLCGSLERYWKARIVEERAGAAPGGAKP